MNLAVARLLLAALWLHGGAAARAEPLAAMLAKVYLTNPRLEAGAGAACGRSTNWCRRRGRRGGRR